jgi:hypothetical protein
MRITIASFIALCALMGVAQAQIGGGISNPLVTTQSVTFQSFTTSANGTYTPNANLLFAIVECVGQGGGGGGAAASATGGCDRQ